MQWPSFTMGHVEETKEIKPHRFQHSNLRFLSIIEVETLISHFSRNMCHFSEKTRHFSKKMSDFSGKIRHFSEKMSDFSGKIRHFSEKMSDFSGKTSLILQTPSVVCNWGWIKAPEQSTLDETDQQLRPHAHARTRIYTRVLCFLLSHLSHHHIKHCVTNI